MEELPKSYNQTIESDIYKLWQLSGYFNPDNLQGEPFCIIMPPPNATGTLHIGHAYETSLQDTIIRFQRMRGKKTLWLPGTDHAAIATNTKVEKLLIKQDGKNRHDLGRELFVQKVEDFVAQSRGTIQSQIKALGASADWSREAFTLDEPRNLAVRTAFKRMYDDGLIYRGFRVINWDPKGQTAVSDDEVVHKQEQGQLFFFRYSPDFPIEIASTRPETKFGDTAIAVNPNDPRYQEFIGKEFDTEFAGVKLHLKVIADESVDSTFGTGALGVTPAHSTTDYELALKHQLPLVSVINEYGKMMDNTGHLVAGKKTKEAREIVIEYLSHNGLLSKIDFIDQNIPTAERTGAVIEPLPKLQWFIDVNKKFKLKKSNLKNIPADSETSLKALMRSVVESGEINILPERESKKYFHWIDNLRDWNISRQLWYGHRIPVWYKANDKNQDAEAQVHVDVNPPQESGWIQDEDTLDTWFSSALWTFATLGWPNDTQDLKTFHPTNVMSPGYEILFFWVARMILMSTYHLGEIPFQTVYLHGIVRDAKGQKFSKSLDNGIDPLDIINKFGTDALRMSLLVGVGAGNDVKFDLAKVKGYRNFANKIWNAARFVYQNTDALDLKEIKLIAEDQKILDELQTLTIKVTEQIESLDLAHASEDLYHYFWHTFADKIIEESKAKFADENLKASRQLLLLTILETCLRLLHPFMPYVTEAIWQLHHTETLMIQKWPNEVVDNSK